MCSVRVAAVCTFVRIAARHSAFSFRFSRAPGLDLPLPGLDSAARVGSSPTVVGCTCSAPIALDPPLSVLAGPEHLPPAVGTPGSQSLCNFGPRSRGGALGHCCLVPVSPPARTLGRSRQHARLLVRSAALRQQRRRPC
ncbi:hypothetical protein NDU88_003814 [Pleurodeles waltl]|uniref:Secreted protein n=1 Tax=Pleurodeles waltl TaxID=8319 RepID=A0AAV7LJI3_PLEWA|nr:hypothetical protein NDU88_003814 [Pleurodeles waltl]